MLAKTLPIGEEFARMLAQDLRIALRHLRTSAGFSATAVMMLALGIGATTTIFSIVEGVLLRPLPFPHPEQLISLGDILVGADVGGNGEAGVTAPDVIAYTRDTHSFQNLGGYQPTGYELSGIGEPAQINATRMSGGAFPALGGRNAREFSVWCLCRRPSLLWPAAPSACSELRRPRACWIRSCSG